MRLNQAALDPILFIACKPTSRCSDIYDAFLSCFAVGVFYAISTLLNQIVLFHFPGAEEDAGRIGLCIVVAGMMGSVCCGVVLDRTHRFKCVDC